MDHNVYLLELTSGKVQFVLAGPGVDISGAAFSPKGKQLASGSEDGTVR